MVTLKGNNGTYEGTSEDNKPLNVPVNTEFYELDTGKTYYFDGEAWQEEPPCKGGSFTPTSAQLAAMNSGITEEDVTQIGENENNILSCKAFTDNASIDSNRKLYISATEPTGDIPKGSTWIDGKTIKTYNISNNLIQPDFTFNKTMGTNPTLTFPYSEGDNRATAFIYVEPNTTYTFSASNNDRLYIGGYTTRKTAEELAVYTRDTPLTANVIIASYGSDIPNVYSFTTPDNVTMVGIYYAINNAVTDAMYNIGSTALPYEAYYAPNWS